mgnify:FL=1
MTELTLIVLCALIFALAISNIVLVSMLKELREQSKGIEDRTFRELESFRERVKSLERREKND